MEIQPEIKQGVMPGESRRYHSGSLASRRKLMQLGFDPIAKLVKQYEDIEKEIQKYNDMRDGKTVWLDANGKARTYTIGVATVHLGLYDKLAKIGSDLLRYNYGRVPEVFVPEVPRTPLIVNLSQAGDTYAINNKQAYDEDFEEDL